MVAQSEVISQEEIDRINEVIMRAVHELREQLQIDGAYITVVKIAPKGAWTTDAFAWPEVGPTLEEVLLNSIDRIDEAETADKQEIMH